MLCFALEPELAASRALRLRVGMLFLRVQGGDTHFWFHIRTAEIYSIEGSQDWRPE